MGGDSQPDERRNEISAKSGSAVPSPAVLDLRRRFSVALVLYTALAVLVWFTMDEGRILVLGRLVELRWIPLLVIGGLVLRTVLTLQAEKVRREKDQNGSSTP